MAKIKQDTGINEPKQNKELEFSSLDLFLAEVKKILLERCLRLEWVEQLVENDMGYLEQAFEKQTLPIYAAFEIYITEDESARERVPQDNRLSLEMTDQAKSHLQRLVELGLWGDSIEGVATTLVYQQLASKLEAGVLPLPVRKSC